MGADEKKFNETLERMLKTAPDPQKPKHKRGSQRVQKGKEKPSGDA